MTVARPALFFALKTILIPNLLQDELNSTRFPKVAQAFLPVVWRGR
jgi:hypothetical protein